MEKYKPDYQNYGMSVSMENILRIEVEKQLIRDLSFYKKTNNQQLYFDWSQSCIEGHDAEYLDSSLENYSGIAMYDLNGNIVAEGWMDFVIEGVFFCVFWDQLTLFDDKGIILSEAKSSFGIPPHIWKLIPLDYQYNYRKNRMPI